MPRDVVGIVASALRHTDPATDGHRDASAGLVALVASDAHAPDVAHMIGGLARLAAHLAERAADTSDGADMEASLIDAWIRLDAASALARAAAASVRRAGTGDPQNVEVKVAA